MGARVLGMLRGFPLLEGKLLGDMLLGDMLLGDMLLEDMLLPLEACRRVGDCFSLTSILYLMSWERDTSKLDRIFFLPSN